MSTAPEILAEIRALPKTYTPFIREIRKARSAGLKGASAAEVISLAQALEELLPQEWKWVAYELVRFHPAAYAAVSEAQVAAFADGVASWYAVDGLGTILVGPLWAKGRISDELIEAWSRSPNRWLRRSALVATVGLNARGSGGPGDARRTLPICRTLAADRDDMVEKALSWALRVLSQRDRAAVEGFMAELGDVVGARVRREVRLKLTTGTKNQKAGVRRP